jgi:hypothetical protein
VARFFEHGDELSGSMKVGRIAVSSSGKTVS